MDSRKRSEGHQDEQENAKKRKMGSLLLEVANFEKLKELMNHQEVDVKETGYFSLTKLNGQSHEFEQCPALFAATLLDKWQSVSLLVNNYPHFHFKKEEKKEVCFLNLPMDVEKRINVLELVGATCILCGDQGAVVHGLLCWNEAIELRFANESGFVIRKSILVQSDLQKKVFRNEFEIEYAEDFKSLQKNLQKNPNLSKIQSFLVCQRILTSYDCFPNGFFIQSLMEFAINDLKKAKRGKYFKSLSRAYSTLLYIFRLLRTTNFEESIYSNPLDSFDLTNLIMREYRKVLEDRYWPDPKTNSFFAFNDLMNTLWFCTTHQITLGEQLKFWPGEHKMMEEISDLILTILRILVLIPKIKTTKSERKDLKNCLAKYTNLHEKEQQQKPNLLIKACRMHREEQNTDLELIISLLLKTGTGKWGEWDFKFLLKVICREMNKKN